MGKVTILEQSRLNHDPIKALVYLAINRNRKL